MKNTGSKVIVLLLLLNHYWLIACPYKCISEEFNLRDRQHVPVVPERDLISQPRVEYPSPPPGGGGGGGVRVRVRVRGVRVRVRVRDSIPLYTSI